MLEKQKEWCQKQIKKGGAWIKEHEFYIGIVAGGAAAIVGQLVAEEILKPKNVGISLWYIENDDGSWSDDLGVETFGINRFGKRNDGYRGAFDQGTADWIIEHLHKIRDDINEHNSNL